MYVLLTSVELGPNEKKLSRAWQERDWLSFEVF
jgi:hypothetical protein